MKKYLLFLLVISSCFYLSAQSNRIEYPMKSDFEGFVQYRNSETLVTLSLAKKGVKGTKELKIDFYDKDFKAVRSTLEKVKDRSFLMDSCRYDNSLYLFYKDRRDALDIVTIDLEKRIAKTINTIFDIDVDLLKTKAFQDKIVFQVFQDKTFKFMVFNLASGEWKTISYEKFDKRRTFISVKDFTLNENGIDVYYVDLDETEKFEILTLSYDGAVKDNYTLNIGDNFYILNLNVDKFGDQTLLSGNYSDDKNEESIGVFIGELSDKKHVNLTQIPFVKLNAFLETFSEKEMNVLSRKQKKANEKDAEIVIPQPALARPLYKVSDGYCLMTELFIHYYRQNSNNKIITVGWESNMGIMVKFDEDLNYVWDSGIEVADPEKGKFSMESMGTFYLREKTQMVQENVNDSTVTLAVTRFENVRYRVFDQKDGKLLTENKIKKPDQPNLKLKRNLITYNGFDYFLSPWNEYYLLQGTQTILDKKADVYFVEKLKLN